MQHKVSIGITPRPIHPFVVYYTDSVELHHQSYVVISDCLRHCLSFPKAVGCLKYSFAYSEFTTFLMEQHLNTKIVRILSIYAIMKMTLEFLLSGIFLQHLMVKVLVMDLVAQLNALLQELACKDHMMSR